MLFDLTPEKYEDFRASRSWTCVVASRTAFTATTAPVSKVTPPTVQSPTAKLVRGVLIVIIWR